MGPYFNTPTSTIFSITLGNDHRDFSSVRYSGSCPYFHKIAPYVSLSSRRSWPFGPRSGVTSHRLPATTLKILALSHAEERFKLYSSNVVWETLYYSLLNATRGREGNSTVFFFFFFPYWGTDVGDDVQSVVQILPERRRGQVFV